MGEELGELHRALRGGDGTKVDRLVSDLLELYEGPDREDKVVIFSQWPMMLGIVSESLMRNNIPSVTVMATGKAGFSKIEAFKQENSKAKVLLLSLSLGAEGLDLVCANRVFLLEPILNNAQERQAIARCNRLGALGSSRRTYVRRYVVKNTVEQRILEVQQRNRQESAENEDEEKPKARSAWAGSKQKKMGKQSADAHGLSVKDLQFILCPR